MKQLFNIITVFIKLAHTDQRLRELNVFAYARDRIQAVQRYYTSL